MIADPAGLVDSCCRVSCCFLWTARDLTACQIGKGIGDLESVSSSLREVRSLPEVAVTFNGPVGYPTVDAVGDEQVR